MNTVPKISVIMSVYNAEKFLASAIESILNQTYQDFEFIIINDGSTDNSENIIKKYNDPRLKLISRENKGLVASLNEGLKIAKGEYIARMDADDISLPNRLEAQINFLDSHNIDLCGSWVKTINEEGKVIGEYTYPPLEPEKIKSYALRHNPFIHSTVMFKKIIIDKVGYYNEKYRHIEDYELWTRVLAKFKAANMPQFLMQYRILKSGITKSKNLEMRLRGVMVRWLALKRLYLNHDLDT